MKLRQPSAGNERIEISTVRRITRTSAETLDTLDKEAPRALAVAREWEGHARAASWDMVSEPLHDNDVAKDAGGQRRDPLTSDGDPDTAPQHSDPTGEIAMYTPEEAAIYEVLVHTIYEVDQGCKLIDGMLGKLRQSHLDAATTHKLTKANAAAGQCDACNHHCDPTKDRDDRLKDAGDDRRYCRPCYMAWTRNQRDADPVQRGPFEKLRLRRLAKEGAA